MHGTSGTGARRTAAGPGRRPSRSTTPRSGDGNPGYINANGFDEVYGDYGEIAVMSAGKTFATWSEGFSYTGPGGTWFNVQR
jgi:hypothetical protein